jgi:hypothetical protein
MILQHEYSNTEKESRIGKIRERFSKIGLMIKKQKQGEETYFHHQRLNKSNRREGEKW